MGKMDKRTKWSYCVGATGRDAAYALVSMYLMTYVQYTMKLTVAQFFVISASIVACLIWDAVTFIRLLRSLDDIRSTPASNSSPR